MIPVGEPYRADGPIDVRSVGSTFILGTIAATFAAGMVTIWERSRFPTGFIAPVVQGGMIGLTIYLVTRRLKLRNPWLLGTVGLACGLISVVLLQSADYAHILDEITRETRQAIERDQALTPDQKREQLSHLAAHSKEIGEEALFARTGHRGVIGSFLLRAGGGFRHGHAEVTGPTDWIFSVIEVGLVVAVSTVLAATKAGSPFCEDCECWCEKTTGRLILPGEAAAPLADAVKGDEPAKVVELRDRMTESPSNPTAGTDLHTCPGCDQTFADVWHKSESSHRGHKDTTTRRLVKRVRISPEMAEVLRRPATATGPEPAEGATAG